MQNTTNLREIFAANILCQSVSSLQCNSQEKVVTLAVIPTCKDWVTIGFSSLNGYGKQFRNVLDTGNTRDYSEVENRNGREFVRLC